MEAGPSRARAMTILGGAAVVMTLVLVVIALVPVSSPSPQAPKREVTIDMTISPGNGGEAVFSPANVTVPSGVLVRFVVTNFDSTTHAAPPLAQSVSGTEGGTASYQTGPASSPTSLQGLAATDISHTFSIDFGSHVLNVPVSPADGPGNPSVVIFETTFSASGTLVWYCDALCGDLPMEPPGSMAGFVTVA